MKCLINTIVVILLIFPIVYSQDINSKHHSTAALNCKECHICDLPTYEKPCLKIMPDFKQRKGITVYNKASEVAEIIKIDILSNLYEPTIFTHRLHAEMSDMAGGCVLCHHNNPPGRIATCRECHEPTESGIDLTKPGLKGAYHRQCLSCHREWSHSNNCNACHVLKEKATSVAKISDKEKFKKVDHPRVVEPTVLVYKTEENDEGPLVTFYHNDHSQYYDLKCVDCHRNESCTRCHDNKTETVKEDKDIHENCIGCHEYEIDNNCKYCHDTKRRSRFNHENTGFSLSKFHSSLDCKSCHNPKDKIRGMKPKKDCNACHKGWQAGTFNHRVTGLILDENHSENACEDCHINRNFSARPLCTECHDDMKYPQNKPGKKVKY